MIGTVLIVLATLYVLGVLSMFWLVAKTQERDNMNPPWAFALAVIACSLFWPVVIFGIARDALTPPPPDGGQRVPVTSEPESAQDPKEQVKHRWPRAIMLLPALLVAAMAHADQQITEPDGKVVGTIRTSPFGGVEVLDRSGERKALIRPDPFDPSKTNVLNMDGSKKATLDEK